MIPKNGNCPTHTTLILHPHIYQARDASLHHPVPKRVPTAILEDHHPSLGTRVPPTVIEAGALLPDTKG